jgi:hypothetical protein
VHEARAKAGECIDHVLLQRRGKANPDQLEQMRKSRKGSDQYPYTSRKLVLALASCENELTSFHYTVMTRVRGIHHDLADRLGERAALV